MTWFPAKSRSNSRHAGRFAWAGLTLVLAGLVLFGASVALTTLAASELDSVNQRQTIVRIATVLALVIGSLLLGAFWCVISGYQRRLAAGALREIEQARQSEERFRSLVQNMSDAILILDSAGVIQYASPAAEHGWGYGDGELLGRLALSLVVAEEQPRARAQFCSGCEQPGATWTTELHLRNADGSLRDVEAIATNLLDRPAVGGVVVTYRDITERNTHERTLKELAFLDNLTGLANWSRLRSELERTFEGKSASGQLGLLLLDIDHFREVNDTFGHQRGDQLLRQVGERLAAQLANGDVVARLGGDEFAMLLRGVDAARARARADRLLAALDLPFEIDGAPVQLSGSIGIALHPDHGTDADMLFSRADIAMYTAKDKRSGCVVYAPDQDHHSPERLALVHDLRRAIERDEFVLHFQPQIDVRSGVLSGCEALVRWQHPVRGLLSPDAFIPAALDSRLIQPLSRWVLRKTLEQFGAWRSAGLSLPVSVNLSAYDLRDTRLPDYIAELTACNDALAHHLRIEITESSLMVDPDGSREVLARLREQGVQIAIDDFGTGYSSLAYLKDLPVDELKIDKSFVRDMATDPGARAIVRAIIDLADDLQLRVVAEGVEDRATWEALAALGCDLAQGYYFSRPLAADDLVAWVHNSQHHLETDEARRVESALTERVRERGARLTAEEEFTARKRAEAALRESEERLRLAIEAAEQQREGLAQTENLRALGQMASGVAHDLNQSLVLIAGFSDLAARALDDPRADIDSAREALATVARAAMDGGQTVKRLLMFARNRPDSANERVNLESLLQEVAQAYPHLEVA